MTTSGATIELADVRKSYRTRRGEQLQALARTSLRINAGEFVAVVGPSGCGKTTLLNIVAGLTGASAGTIRIDGAAHGLQSTRIGAMFQEPTLLDWRTVLQNVLLPIEIAHKRRDAFEARAIELIRMLGLSGFEKAYPYELSGGMQQRVAIARSLVLDPALLVMDEPFSALDTFTRERLALELLDIWERNRKTVIFVTHNIEEAIFLADRLLVMAPRPGRVIADIDVNLTRPRHSDIVFEEGYLAQVAAVRRILQGQGESQ